MKFTNLLFIVLPLLILANFASSQSARAEGRDAILVFDASGSMWGKVGGRHKIEIAREVVADVVGSLPKDTRLGLMAYGHNRKGDCEDIELLLPVGPVNPKELLSKVNGILPKGKTPLTTAIRMAVAKLKIGENAASVILITDGIETCGGDPCALAKELAAQGLDFTAHVIAFDLSSNEAASIRCLADETGGLFLEAGDENGLERALISAFEALAVQPSGANLLARNSTTGDPLQGASWSVKNDDDEVLAQLSSPEGGVELEPGEYQATAAWENQTRQIRFTVMEGRKTPVEVAFGPATLRLAAAESRDSTPDLIGGWKIFALDENGEPVGGPVKSIFTSQPEFRLEPGRYRVTFDYGKSQGSLDLELEGGEIESRLVITGSGTVQVKTLRAGEPLKGARNYRIFPVGADGKPEEKAILSNFTSTPSFAVPAGRYLVTTNDGPVEARETVEVDAGETAEVVLSFDTGTLKVSSSRAGLPSKNGRRYSVFRADDEDGKPIAGRFTTSPSFVLPPGNYIVSAMDGTVMEQVAVTIQPGKDSTVILDFDTGEVSARAVQAGEPTGKGGTFTVYRAGGEEKVVSQFTRKVSFALPPGNYEMHFKGGDITGKTTFTIESGKTTELDVPVTGK